MILKTEVHWSDSSLAKIWHKQKPFLTAGTLLLFLLLDHHTQLQTYRNFTLNISRHNGLDLRALERILQCTFFQKNTTLSLRKLEQVFHILSTYLLTDHEATEASAVTESAQTTLHLSCRSNQMKARFAKASRYSI